MKVSLLIALVGAGSTLAAPLPFLDELGDAITEAIGGSGNEAAPAPVPANEIPDFTRIAQFARASYCTPQVVQEWACGEACDANPQTQPIIAGGDSGEIPRCKRYPHLEVFCSDAPLTAVFCSLRRL
jgi:hypothetical protein